jgi:hypothetical protein
MKTRRVVSSLVLASFAAWIGISLVGTGEVEQPPPVSHAAAPSLDCLECHGSHPAAADSDGSAGGGGGLALPADGGSTELTCSQCHGASQAVAAAYPSSCVGCHAIGGYPLKEALETLAEDGHPNVVPMTKTVPGDCLMCHEETLGPLMHRLHLVESPKFTEHFPAGCVRCHLLGEDGATTVEDLPIE